MGCNFHGDDIETSVPRQINGETWSEVRLYTDASKLGSCYQKQSSSTFEEPLFMRGTWDWFYKIALFLVNSYYWFIESENVDEVVVFRKLDLNV